MKRFKIIALVVAVLMSFSAFSGCFYEPERNYTPAYPEYGNYPINNPHYSERQYVEPDKEAIAECMDLVITLANDPSAFDDMCEEREDFYGYYYEVLNSNSLARLDYYLNVKDEALGERQQAIYSYAIELNNQTFEMEKAIFNGVHGEKMREILGEDYYNMVMSYNVKDEAFLELEEKVNALTVEYGALSSNNYADTDRLAEVYIELITTQNEIARRTVGPDGQPIYNNYFELSYAEIFGRDYTPDEAVGFRDSIKTNIGAFRDFVYGNYKSGYTADKTLSTKEIKNYMPKIINNTAPQMINSWNYMMERGLYDFEVSNTKMGTSFVTEFSAYDDAFLFLGARNSLLSDLNTVIHEFGHYNAVFGVDPEKAGESTSSYDLLETHSQAFELVSLPAVEKVLDNYYTQTYRESYIFNMMLNMAWSMLFNSAIDEFEYSVFTADPAILSKNYLSNSFSKIMNKYWPYGVGYEFYEIPHIFESPAYCISYATSLVFSSVIWGAENNVEKYLEVVSYGADHPLGYVVEQTGLSDPLAPETVANVGTHFIEYCAEYFGWKIK